MTNWILVAGLGLGAYYLYSQNQINSSVSLLPVTKPMPIALQESNIPGIFEVPTSIVKRYGTPDQTTADTLYVPPPVFSVQPVRYSLF